MKKLLQGALLPFTIFTSGLLLLGCDQMQQDESEAMYSEHSQAPATKPAPSSELANGNIFYMARDVADMQYKTQGYVAKLQQAQTDLQQAIEQKIRISFRQPPLFYKNNFMDLARHCLL